MRTVTYTDDEKKIAESGISAIRNILMGADMEAKERLLFCLDYYLDPYYKKTLPYEAEVAALLQEVIVSPNPLSVKEDALNLLISYEYPPFSILENNLSKVETELLPDITYALNMGKTDSLLYALLEKCCVIYQELRECAREQDPSHYGEMPGTAIIKYYENGDYEIESYLKCEASYTWRLEQKSQAETEKGRLPLTVVRNDVCHQTKPVSGMYFPEAAFWISFHLEKKTAYLIYQMGPRFGRSFTYDVSFQDGYKAELTNEQIIWVM